MKCIRFVWLAVILASCASSNKVERSVKVPEGEPLWLYSAQEFCKDRFICASAEGASIAESDARAQKSLAGIFEMQVKGEFKFSKHSFSGDEQTEMEEYVEDNISKKIDLVLKGAEIKERFKKNGLHFSLAALDKAKTRNLLLAEIRDIDSKLKHFYNIKSKLYVKKLNILFNERQILNEKLIIVDEGGIPSPISFDQINALKFSDAGGSKLKLEVGEAVPENLRKKLSELLTEVGYKITEKDEDFSINVTFSDNEEFLNVRGFKKFTFEMNMKAMNKSGKEIGSYVVSFVSNGRDKKDAFLKIRKKFVSRLESNIDKLNLK